MEQELKIIIVNAQYVTKKDTGEVLTKVGYMTLLQQTDKFYGYSVLDAWCSGEAYNKLRDFVGKEVSAIIGLKSGKNNSLGAYIKKIDKISL